MPNRYQWQNWNGVVTCQPSQLRHVTSEMALQDIVADSASRHASVRIAGGGHSFCPLVATKGTLIDLDIAGDVVVTGANVTIPGGRRLRDVFDPMWAQGRALKNMGELDCTSVAGAISTGVHGTGLALPSLSDSLVAARLVTASGDVIDVEAGSELMRALRVSMGMLGVMSETTLETIPAYDLQETSYYCTLEQILEEWEALLRANRHFNFYYLPSRAALATYSDIFPPVPDGLSDAICFVQIRNACPPGPVMEDGKTLDRRDRMNRILAYDYPVQYREIEFAVPIEETAAVFRDIRSLIKEHHSGFAQPIDFRFAAQDDALLSWCHDGPKTIVSVPEAMDVRYEDILSDFESLFDRYGGLPHWGKEHRMTRERLAALQPGFRTFVEIRRSLDPGGLFLNDYLRPIFQ